MAEHTRDSDCTLDATDTCTGCGVYHGEPCAECGGRGFHPDISGVDLDHISTLLRECPQTESDIIDTFEEWARDIPKCLKPTSCWMEMSVWLTGANVTHAYRLGANALENAPA